MKDRSNVNFFLPNQKPDANKIIVGGEALTSNTINGVANTYIVGRDSVIRIIPAADMAVKFVANNDLGLQAAVTLANGILLKANEEYFLNSGKFECMVATANTANVIICTINARN